MRKYVFDGDPPEGGIPANHVTSWAPGVPYDGSVFLMAGFDEARAGGTRLNDPVNAGKANTWYSVRQPANTRPGYDWRGGPGYVVISNNGPTRPSVPLYGVPGTDADGVKYEQATSRFYIDVPDAPGQTGGAGPAGDPYRAYSGGTGAGPGPAGNRSGKELGLYEGLRGRIWYARTGQESAQSPDHPGINYAGAGVWRSEWGTPESQGLPARAYLVTADDPMDPATARPAAQEYSIIVQRLMAGDDAAYEALSSLGVDFPAEGGLLSRLF